MTNDRRSPREELAFAEAEISTARQHLDAIGAPANFGEGVLHKHTSLLEVAAMRRFAARLDCTVEDLQTAMREQSDLLTTEIRTAGNSIQASGENVHRIIKALDDTIKKFNNSFDARIAGLNEVVGAFTKSADNGTAALVLWTKVLAFSTIGLVLATAGLVVVELLKKGP